jgi:hypothetical protein
MQSNLYFICPFSHLEPYLREQVGGNHLFATAMAGIPPLQDQRYCLEIAGILRRNRVKQIVLVNDTGCRFLQGVMQKEEGGDMPCERQLRRLFSEFLLEILVRGTMEKQLKCFAVINLIEQARRLVRSDVLGPLIKEQDIRLTGMVTNRSAGSVTSFRISNTLLTNGLSGNRLQPN